jgi:hypothetical protein
MGLLWLQVVQLILLYTVLPSTMFALTIMTGKLQDDFF